MSDLQTAEGHQPQEEEPLKPEKTETDHTNLKITQGGLTNNQKRNAKPVPGVSNLQKTGPAAMINLQIIHRNEGKNPEVPQLPVTMTVAAETGVEAILHPLVEEIRVVLQHLRQEAEADNSIYNFKFTI